MLGYSSAKFKASFIVEIRDHRQHKTYIKLARTDPKRSNKGGMRKGRHHCTFAIETTRSRVTQYAEIKIKSRQEIRFDTREHPAAKKITKKKSRLNSTK